MERLIALLLLLGERCEKDYKIERYTDSAVSGFKFAPVKTG